MIKERPIIFNAEMVIAILARRKTQTRRVLNPQPSIDISGNFVWRGMNFGKDSYGKPKSDTLASQLLSSKTKKVLCPFGKIGDHLWVRETFCKIDGQTQPWIATDYRANYKNGERLGDFLQAKKWTPSIHMPRLASRITLEITGVSIQRLNDISRGYCMAEGCPFPNMADGDNPKDWYRDLWESINGKGSWELNPWVWKIEFKVLEVKP